MLDKNGYIFEDKYGQINIFIYIKLTREELAKAMPLSDPSELEKDYLCATFINGIDYIGSSNYPEIETIIKTNKMKNILTTSFKDITFNISESEYKSNIEFVKRQLDIKNWIIINL